MRFEELKSIFGNPLKFGSFKFDSLTVEQLQLCSPENANETVLWLLTHHAIQNRTATPLKQVWQRCGKQLPKELLLKRGSDNMSFFSYVTEATFQKTDAQFFFEVWTLLRSTIRYEDLNAAATSGSAQDRSPFRTIIMLAYDHPAFDVILGDIIQDIPEAISDEELHCFGEKKESIAQLLLLLKGGKYLELINQKNTLLKALKAADYQEKYAVVAMGEVAKKAEEVGYRNSYFELARTLVDHGKNIEAAFYYSKVPKDSINREKALVRAYNLYLDASFLTVDSKNTQRISAIKCALQMVDSYRTIYLQDIAWVYIYGRKRDFTCNQALPVELTNALNKSTSAPGVNQLLLDYAANLHVATTTMAQSVNITVTNAFTNLAISDDWQDTASVIPIAPGFKAAATAALSTRSAPEQQQPAPAAQAGWRKYLTWSN